MFSFLFAKIFFFCQNMEEIGEELKWEEIGAKSNPKEK